MPDRRPLPDSDEVQDRRANERLARWATILMGLIVLGLVVLLALSWFVRE